MTTNEDTAFFLDALKTFQEITGNYDDPAGLPLIDLQRILREAQHLKMIRRRAQTQEINVCQ